MLKQSALDLNKAFDSIDGFDGNGHLGCRLRDLQTGKVRRSSPQPNQKHDRCG